MGIFVNYPSNLFSSLSDTPQTIIQTTTNSIWVQAIIVTNLGEEDIRVNLKFVRDTGSITEIFLAKNFLVPNYKVPREYKDKTLFNTVDLVDTLGIKKNLQYFSIPNLTESLVIYSNGYNQKFDCSIEYTLLNELPM